MPTGKGFIDKGCLNYMLKFAKETPEAQKLRAETLKMKSNSQMISDIDSAEIIKWMAKLIGAKRCLEIGVFTGYTTLILAQTIPKDGKVIGFERKEEWINIGRPFWKDAQVEDKIEIKLGDAVDNLTELTKQDIEKFDFAFIDADKANNSVYMELCLKLIRPGGIIIIDNVFFFGRVWDELDEYKNTPAIRSFNEDIFKDPRVDTCMIAASDGLILCFVK